MKNIGLSVMAFSLLALPGCTEDTVAAGNGRTVSEALPVFVRNSVRNDLELEALLQGRLVVDGNGCLRVGEAGPFVIWHHDSRIERTDDGRIKITDGYSDNTAYVGDEVAMGGGQGNRVPPATGGQAGAPPNVTEPIPAACASGEIWTAGRLMTEAERQRLPKH
ncbi:hypothetical protein IQ03_03864 [Gemmobacter caeni]|uniref:Uncharacterized protein n=1 Tax=Gemmobacter caeni TaxID=589035 RepID=A0A2T6B9D9_9RHOB|nr:hypothetical protein [Gemmobacter caeni]PTX52679.1 hypothetical protein C8N34_102498 [Gemmobacter caeni]TWI94866.1 hypothetical protein IQ03_03864 [Gemmobacter caeni]